MFSPLFEEQINDFTHDQLFVELSWWCGDPRNISIFVPQDEFKTIIKPIPKERYARKTVYKQRSSITKQNEYHQFFNLSELIMVIPVVG